MALGPGVPDPPTATHHNFNSRSRHRLREDVAVRANAVLGGLHHEYFFFKWCSFSLKDHLVFFQLLCAIPLSLWAILTMRSEGTLTIAWGFRMALVCSALCAIGAALFWYTFFEAAHKESEYQIIAAVHF
jgi:hypothetical protein